MNWMDLSGDTAANLYSVVLNSYYGILGGKLECIYHPPPPPEHPIIAIWNYRIQNGRLVAETVHSDP